MKKDIKFNKENDIIWNYDIHSSKYSKYVDGVIDVKLESSSDP